MKTAVVANPHSSAGRTGQRWTGLRQALEDRLGPLEVCFTESVGHAAELTRGLLDRGFDRIIGVGGDGTFNEMANGFIVNDRPVRSGAMLGLLPAGTGGDLKRTLDLPSALDQVIEILATGVPLEIDLGKIAFESHAGGRRTRYFINLTSWGMGGEVSKDAKNRLMFLGGKVAFLWATVKNILTYSGRRIDLTLDGRPAGSHDVLNIAVGNGPYHGGGMYVCPDAVLNDGKLDVTVIGKLGLAMLARDVRYLYNGSIYNHRKVNGFQARQITASSPETVKIEVDGEPLGRLPVEVTVLPRAMSVIVPSDSRHLR